MLFFGEKNTFIFFKYISIDKDSLALFHYKDEMISHVSKGNFTLTSLWCGFHEVLILKIALNIHGPPFVLKCEFLMSIFYMYIVYNNRN